MASSKEMNVELAVTKNAAARRLYLSALREARAGKTDKSAIAEKLIKASKLGSHEATYALATWYLYGEYFEKDLKKAILFLRRAVRGGNADACYDLAIGYDNGLGVKRDPQRAFELYLESAMRGNVDAHTQVARCFWDGRGVKRNRTLSDLWSEKYDRLTIRNTKSAETPRTKRKKDSK